MMFENLDRDEPPQVDPGEPILRRQTVDPRVIVRANRRGFTFRATLKRATNGTLVVCDVQERIPARAVVVSFTGRPRVAGQTTTGLAYDCRP
jgi:type IV fimbrial biogenesis protein FimT